jgi:MYXO-CTERM domain-containing protein
VVKAVDSTVRSLLNTATAVTAPLPVVGSVVGAVGTVVGSVDLPGTVGSVTGVVDDTVGAVTGGATGVVSAPGSTPALSGIPAVPGVSGLPSLFDGASAPAADAAGTTTLGAPAEAPLTLEAMLASARQAATMARAAASVVLTLSPADGALRLARDFSPALGAATPGGTSAGSSGAGPGGAAALLAFGLFFAHRAWVRRRVVNDQQAPPAPVYDTDVSPD